MNYLLPLVLVVFANTLYQICTKSVPQNMNPFASLTVTYLVGAIVSTVIFLVFDRKSNFVLEMRKLNWAPVVLGIVIVALEVGWIYAYKVGWQVSTAQIVQCAALGTILIFVGRLLYKEKLSWNKLAGIIICIVGLVLINIKLGD